LEDVILLEDEDGVSVRGRLLCRRRE